MKKTRPFREEYTFEERLQESRDIVAKYPDRVPVSGALPLSSPALLNFQFSLSGGHSLGTAHCTVFTERIYNFSRESDTDPTMNPGFAALLQTACPDNTTEASVYLDLVTPKVLDNQYYAGLQMGFGLLGSDQALTGEPRLRAAVDAYAGSAEKWVADFTAAMVKLGNILELKGEEGQVRTNCRVVNGGRRRQRLVARSR